MDEAMQKRMDDQFEIMVYQVKKQIDAELPKLAAKSYKMLFDALLSEGFSTEQAIEICSKSTRY